MWHTLRRIKNPSAKVGGVFSFGATLFFLARCVIIGKKFFTEDKMFKGVIFDIDGTLYDYQTADKFAMKNFGVFVEKNLGVEEKIFRR